MVARFFVLGVSGAAFWDVEISTNPAKCGDGQFVDLKCYGSSFIKSWEFERIPSRRYDFWVAPGTMLEIWSSPSCPESPQMWRCGEKIPKTWKMKIRQNKKFSHHHEHHNLLNLGWIGQRFPFRIRKSWHCFFDSLDCGDLTCSIVTTKSQEVWG